METCYCCTRTGAATCACKVQVCRRCLKCVEHCTCEPAPAPLTPTTHEPKELTSADLAELDRITG